MTQLLISVKSVEESEIARHANVDVIDLKDPSVGALGALDTDTVGRIVKDVNGSALISATVGDIHVSVDELLSDIALYASLGVDVVKIAASELLQQAGFFTKLMRITSKGISIVVVFFADQDLDFSLIPQLQKSGCYGAMLDTQFKQSSLLSIQPVQILRNFVSICTENGLVSGLAGSVNKSHLETLVSINPTFIGMRGGVCKNQNRVLALDEERMIEAKSVLLNYNSASSLERKGSRNLPNAIGLSIVHE